MSSIGGKHSSQICHFLVLMHYCRKKLENKPGIQFPESLVAQIVNMTERFSFADMKEAFMNTLFLIAAGQDRSDGRGTEGLFERVIIEQLENLRRSIVLGI